MDLTRFIPHGHHICTSSGIKRPARVSLQQRPHERAIVEIRTCKEETEHHDQTKRYESHIGSIATAEADNSGGSKDLFTMPRPLGAELDRRPVTASCGSCDCSLLALRELRRVGGSYHSGPPTSSADGTVRSHPVSARTPPVEIMTRCWSRANSRPA
jgi:hypothetical protein